MCKKIIVKKEALCFGQTSGIADRVVFTFYYTSGSTSFIFFIKSRQNVSCFIVFHFEQYIFTHILYKS